MIAYIKVTIRKKSDGWEVDDGRGFVWGRIGKMFRRKRQLATSTHDRKAHEKERSSRDTMTIGLNVRPEYEKNGPIAYCLSCLEMSEETGVYQ